MTGFLDDEAEVDETAFDSDTGETANVSEDEDEDRIAKRRKSDNGFIASDGEYPECKLRDIISRYLGAFIF